MDRIPLPYRAQWRPPAPRSPAVMAGAATTASDGNLGVGLAIAAVVAGVVLIANANEKPKRGFGAMNPVDRYLAQRRGGLTSQREKVGGGARLFTSETGKAASVLAQEKRAA